MWPNTKSPVDLVTFTEEILNGKLHVLYSVSIIEWYIFFFNGGVYFGFKKVAIQFIYKESKALQNY